MQLNYTHTRLVSSSRLRKPFSRVPAVSAKKNRIKGFPCGPRLFSLFRSLSLEIVFPGVYIYLMLYNVGGCDCTKAKWTAFLFSSGPEWSVWRWRRRWVRVSEWIHTVPRLRGKKGGEGSFVGWVLTWRETHTHTTHTDWISRSQSSGAWRIYVYWICRSCSLNPNKKREG